MGSTAEPEEEVRTTDDWGELYRGQRGVWEDFTGRIERLVEDLLDRNSIEVVQLSARTKTVDSFKGKLRRKGTKYENPLDEVTDFAGIRVITYYTEDVDRVVECLLSEFEIDDELSRGTVAAADPDRFGYQSAQYVGRLSHERRSLTEWSRFADRCVEIQVRTALQHAWSAIDHKLNYKSEREVPRHLKRRLSRLSALLELGDEEFSSLRDATDDLDREYLREIAKGHLDLDVDAASLSAYIDDRKVADTWIPIAVGAGFAEPSRDNNIEERDKRDLLLAIQRVGIKTIAELDRVLTEAERSWGGDVLARILEASRDAGFTGVYAANPFDVVTHIVLYSRNADPEVAAEIDYAPAVQAGLRKVIEAAQGD